LDVQQQLGSESPALKAKYSKLNQPADVALVDYYVSAIEAVKALGPQKSQNDMGLTRLLVVVAKNIPWGDRSAAIRALQTELPEITAPRGDAGHQQVVAGSVQAT
jgi:hypothetical protein